MHHVRESSLQQATGGASNYKKIIVANGYRNMPNSRREGAKALPYLMRPNRRLSSWLAQQYLEFWNAHRDLGVVSHDQLISVHIRWSDKLVDGDLHPVSTYLQYVLSIASRWNILRPVVFLSSEDGMAIKLFQEAVAASPNASHVRVIKYDYHRMTMNCGGLDIAKSLGAHGSGLQKERAGSILRGNNSHLTYKARMDLLQGHGTCGHPSDIRDFAQGHSEDLTLISLLNLYLALECRHIICLTSSNWCWMLRYLADQKTTTITGEYGRLDASQSKLFGTRIFQLGPQGPGPEVPPPRMLAPGELVP